MKYKCLVNYLVGFIVVVFVLLVEDVEGRPALLGRGLPLLRAIQDIVNKQTPTKHTRDTTVCTNENHDIMPILQLIKELFRSDIDYEKKIQKKSNASIQKIPKKYFYFRVGVKPKYKKLLKLRKYHNKEIALGKEDKIAEKHNKYQYGLFEDYTSTSDSIYNGDSFTTDHKQVTGETIGEEGFTVRSTTGAGSENVAKSGEDTESDPTSTEIVETATCPLFTTTITEEISTTTHRPKTEDGNENTWSSNESSTSLSQTSTENSTSTNQQPSYSAGETSTSSITSSKQKAQAITESGLIENTTEKPSAESETSVEQITIDEDTKVTDSVTTRPITAQTGLPDNQTDNKHGQIYPTSTFRTGRNSIGHFSANSAPLDSDHSRNITSDDRDFKVNPEFRQNGSILFEVPEDTRSFTHRCEGCSKSEHSPNGTGVRYGDGRLSNSGAETADEYTGLEPAKLERDIGNQTEKFFEGEKFIDTGYGNIVVEAITLPEPLQSYGNIGKDIFGFPQRDASSERVTDRSSEPAQNHDVTERSVKYYNVGNNPAPPNDTKTI